MKYWLLVLAACAGSQARPTDPGQAQAEIRDVIVRLETANNAGDVEGWVGQFADDGIYMGGGAPEVTTRDALREVARAGFRNKANVRIEPVEIVVSGDWAFSRAKVSGPVVLANGERIEVDIKEIIVFRRVPNAGWKIARLINNSNR